MSSSEPKIRWGIVGAGRIAKTFANDIEQSSKAEITSSDGSKHEDLPSHNDHSLQALLDTSKSLECIIL